MLAENGKNSQFYLIFLWAVAAGMFLTLQNLKGGRMDRPENIQIMLSVSIATRFP